MEQLTLGSHYNFRNIFRQCISPIMMMIFVSIYSVVDGFFIANFDSENAFAGVNLIFPLIMIVGGIGFMFGSGGSALSSKLLGEAKHEDANKVFSLMLFASVVIGFILAVLLFPFIDNIAHLLASLSNDSSQEMVDKAILYGRILILGQPFYILQNEFQTFFSVDEKPKIGFLFTLGSGIINICFDALFIVCFHWGVVGAACATIMGFIFGSLGPITYFKFNKNNLLSIVKCKFDLCIIGKCCSNGISDFIFNISSSVVSIIYNIQLLKYIGQDGVSAYGVIMYFSFVALAISIGIVIGMAPIIGYNYGEQNHKELHSVIKRLMIVMAILSIFIFGISFGLARPLANVFCKTESLIALSEKVLRIYSISYLFSGFSILITGIFTALNNGLVSGFLSLFRCFIFQITFVFVLPEFFGNDGLWFAIVAAEFCSVLMAFINLLVNKKKYHY